MSIEQFIKENVWKIGHDNRIYISPNIEDVKLNNTINTICKGIDKEDILAIYDSTVFGSSKEGIVFTKDSLFYRGTLLKAIEVKYRRIKNASYLNRPVESNTRKNESEEIIVLKIENEKKEEEAIVIKNLLKVDLEALSNFINEIKEELD